MRYELYSLKCSACGARNPPQQNRCAHCRGPVASMRRCFRCQAENPPNAYVCITCYTILQQKPQVGILHWHMPWTLCTVVLVVVVGWAGYSIAEQWFAYAEAQIETNAALARQLEMQHREYERRMDND